MTAPNVNITILDGQLGAVSPNRPPLAIVGPAPGAALAANTCELMFKPSQVRDRVGVGPGKTGQLAEAACFALKNGGAPVLVCPTASTTAGGGSVDSTLKTGASVVTLATSPAPDNVYNLRLEFTPGGTVGVAGIIYRYSFDEGANWSALTALGTAVFIEFPGGIRLNMTAATIGGTVRVRTTSPRWVIGELTAALAVLQQSGISYRQGLILGALTTSDVAAIDTAIEAMATAGKYRRFHGHFRVRNVGETMAAYKTAAQTEFSTTAMRRLLVWAGDAYVGSAIDSIEHLRDVAIPAAAYCVQANKQISSDPANLGFGRLPATRICDQSLNPVCYDDDAIGGLDSLRLATMRSWPDDPGGAYITNARLHSAAGSDFRYLQNGLVMDVACETVRSVLNRVLSSPISVNAPGTTNAGFITEVEAQDIEIQVRRALQTAIGGHCSSFAFEVSRTDNILSTEKMNSSLRVVPLAYPKDIATEVGFLNPVRVAA